jgi:putative membrane protein
MMYGFYGDNFMGSGLMGFFGFIIMIAFWAAVIWIIIRIAQEASGGRKTGKSTIRILEERYAKGEIDKEEFKSRKHDLES